MTTAFLFLVAAYSSVDGTIIHETTFGGQIPLIIDGGICRGPVASTVLDLTVTPPAILRPGPVTAQQLEEASGLQID